MKITDLDYVRDIDTVSNGPKGSGVTFTETYAITQVDNDFAFAEAGAFAFGENTFADTNTAVYAKKSKSKTKFLTKTTFEGAAYAEATAIATDSDGSSIKTSKSYSKKSHKGYYISAGF
ncbi:hypothetical protein [Leptothoe spongobia]|uniref:Uncharacterized protein n=1 Tax=Leptothoe spongobia TAU-MAC 1115 TaxID=1967444 RepID=A0A947DCF3_9CYAN|nr:hypothetical protein [Leptothoe spongobia]MBT9314452.1 hypothetical protein [Leptothoe spongobia TAU-MAC 1115]